MGALFRNFAYPTWHWLKRDGINSANREIRRTQWLSNDEIREFQKGKLQNILTFAGQHVPYYRELFGKIGISTKSGFTIEDLNKIPQLTKNVIRREGSRLVSENLNGNGLIGNSTSGSTGEAIRFFTDYRSKAYRSAAGIRSNEWTGWRLGDRQVRLWGAPLDERFATGIRGKLHGYVSSNRFLSSFELSPSRMDDYIASILDFKPVLLIAYPGPLEVFSDHCMDRGVRFPSLRGIVSSAETLWPHQRTKVEQTLGIKIFDRYGSREVGQICSECDAHDGMHISADRVVVEIVDENGQPSPPNESGRILVTDLDNYGMPMIRYDIGDRAFPLETKFCDCGRGLPKLKKIEGRTLEIVRTRDNKSIGGTFWTLLLRSRDGIKQFQVVQKNLDGVTIRIVCDSDLDGAVLEYFTSRIHETCGRGFKVDFERTETIDLTQSGKQRLIVSHVNEQ